MSNLSGPSGPAATKHSWVQNSASTLRKYSNLQSQPQVTATKYLSTYSNKKFEYVLKLFEIPLYLSQVRTQAIKMAVRRRRMRRRLRENRNRVSKRVIRDRMNPLENYSEEEIFDRFRFRLPTITFIMNNIEHSINHNSKKNCALPPVLQLLTCLRFLATGAFHRLVGDSIGISETTTGRCCRSVCDGIISNLLANTFTFPKDNLSRHTKHQFLKVAGIKTSFFSISITLYFLPPKSYYCKMLYNFTKLKTPEAC